MYPGMDLGTEWRARRWRRLLNLIEGLPPNSHFINAMVNDEEYAAEVIDADLPPRGETMVDWPPEVDKLAHIADLLQQLLRATVSANGGKGGKFKPTPRPETAFERVRKRKQWAEYNYLLNMWDQIPDAPDGDGE